MSVFKIRQTIPTNSLSAADLSAALADYVLMSETGLLGDILVHTGDSSMGFDVLNVGADGEVLTANSAQLLGVEWASPCIPFTPAYTFTPAVLVPPFDSFSYNFVQTCNTVILQVEMERAAGIPSGNVGSISGATVSPLLTWYLGSGIITTPSPAPYTPTGIGNTVLNTGSNAVFFESETGAAPYTRIEFIIPFVVS